MNDNNFNPDLPENNTDNMNNSSPFNFSMGEANQAPQQSYAPQGQAYPNMQQNTGNEQYANPLPNQGTPYPNNPQQNFAPQEQAYANPQQNTYYNNAPANDYAQPSGNENTGGFNYSTGNQYYNSPVDVKTNAKTGVTVGMIFAIIGLGILSILLPIVGIIIGIAKLRKRDTIKGIVCLAAAFISMVVLTPIAIKNINSSGGSTVNNSSYSDEVKDEEKADEAAPAADNPSVNTKWYECNVAINGKTFKLPYSNLDSFLKETGYTYETAEDSAKVLNANDSAYVTLYKNGGDTIEVYIANRTNGVLPYTDCVITSVVTYNYEEYEQTVTFPGNLTLGQEISKKELIALFGEPSNSDSLGSSRYYQWEYEIDNSSFANMDVQIDKSGKIEKLEIIIYN